MASKLQKNAIITGYINSYCLVCESYFETPEETSEHIDKVTHADKLLLYPYMEKYGDNRIRKVRKGYFCEFCSILLATATKVSLHVQEKSHYERKGSYLLNRPTGQCVVLAFENLLISEKAWHSFADETCAICNEEFTNEDVHKTKSGHLLKLVQNKVEFGANNNLYRKTDESSFQCLTCNSVFALDTINEHFNNSDHKKLYEKCQAEYKKYDQNKEKKPLKPSENEGKETKPKNNAKEMEPVDKNHNVVENNNSITKNIDNKSESVPKTKDSKGKTAKTDTCKELVTKTSDTKNKMPETDCKEIVPKTSDTKAKIAETDCKEIVPNASVSKTPLDETAEYANGNNLTYNAGNTNAFCRICETKLPATLRSMKEHVNGKEHKNKLAKITQVEKAAIKAKTQITKRPMDKFIESCVTIEGIFHQDVVINDKFCISYANFVLVTKNGSRFRCQSCELTMYEFDVSSHVESPRHARAMRDTPLITSLPETEFIREVRPNIYHCGFCNQIVPRWEEVGSHLQSREHKENKDECAWRLQRHLPAIANHRRQREMELFEALFARRLFSH